MASPRAEARAIVDRLRALGTARNREGMAHYGIVAKQVLGVPMDPLRAEAKRLGRDHALAEALWATGWQEARILAALVDDPAQVTAAQMMRWARDFENWAVCDNACFHLFDQSPRAWAQLPRWAARNAEFVRRAAFATMAGMAVHDRDTPDAPFLDALSLVRAHAHDGRNYVKKGVSWALRSVGNRSPALHAAASALARELAASADAAERWVGRDALRDLEWPLARARAAKKGAARAARAERAASRDAARVGRKSTGTKRSMPSTSTRRVLRSPR
ncbi:MAG: DNA alkylation repair protein [Gemmatimonadetes bacterium]|nr:DNA alkylation repair protein [Gemmatimonadota bacterium]